MAVRKVARGNVQYDLSYRKEAIQCACQKQWAQHALSESLLRLSLTEVLKDSSEELLDNKDEILSGWGPLGTCIAFDSFNSENIQRYNHGLFLCLYFKKNSALDQNRKKKVHLMANT